MGSNYKLDYAYSDFSAAADFLAGALRRPGARRAPNCLRGVLGARIILTPADFILVLG